ncbi:MAG: hypothetical protein ACLR7Z_14610 [Bilophila wadsworthia]
MSPIPEPGDGAWAIPSSARPPQAAASEAPKIPRGGAFRFEKVYLLNLEEEQLERDLDSLGMDRRTLFRKMKDFGLEKE